MNEPSRAARAHVRLRSGGRCERCGQEEATDLHHRKRRDSGDHRVVNLLDLCRDCHAHVHNNPLESLERGWIVASERDPEAVAARLVLWTVMPTYVFLTPDGYGEFYRDDLV